MEIRYNQQNFGVKFVKTDSLEEVARYAIKQNKFELLNNARKKLEQYDTNVALEMNIIDRSAKPQIEFKRYAKVNVIGHEDENYGIYVYKSTEKALHDTNPVEFAFRKILQLADYTPDGYVYKHIVNRHNKDWAKYL